MWRCGSHLRGPIHSAPAARDEFGPPRFDCRGTTSAPDNTKPGELLSSEQAGLTPLPEAQELSGGGETRHAPCAAPSPLASGVPDSPRHADGAKASDRFALSYASNERHDRELRWWIRTAAIAYRNTREALWASIRAGQPHSRARTTLGRQAISKRGRLRPAAVETAHNSARYAPPLTPGATAHRP